MWDRRVNRMRWDDPRRGPYMICLHRAEQGSGHYGDG
ncbi:hypothetical protein E2C01_098325 [Portunus trituberculatus]|uniref:Uncharacterized protein n=1 Tax=Portunus trituberculatus TaxID=210409 RepID=A0A5B7K843_PORTR|nr:hypothetical protein [Portunus trituberculatus]